DFFRDDYTKLITDEGAYSLHRPRKGEAFQVSENGNIAIIADLLSFGSGSHLRDRKIIVFDSKGKRVKTIKFPWNQLREWADLQTEIESFFWDRDGKTIVVLSRAKKEISLEVGRN
ncbi:MAG: hypothetical protein COV44_02815, partial [Deltaproteobacteria bacterium CG11_big_fil_rev_8_21_14_0_20_45_16]